MKHDLNSQPLESDPDSTVETFSDPSDFNGEDATIDPNESWENWNEGIPLAVRILAFAHSFKYLTVSLIRSAFNVTRANDVSDTIKALCKARYLRCLGRAKVASDHDFAGIWYCPTKRAPDYLGHFPARLRSLFQPTPAHTVAWASGGIVTSEKFFLAEHDLVVGRVAAAIISKRCYLVSEVHLRRVEGRYFATPPKADPGPSPLAFGPIPDLIFRCGQREYYVEVELTKKSRGRYSEYFCALSNRSQWISPPRVLWVAPNPRLRENLLRTHKEVSRNPKQRCYYICPPSLPDLIGRMRLGIRLSNFAPKSSAEPDAGDEDWESHYLDETERMLIELATQKSSESSIRDAEIRSREAS